MKKNSGMITGMTMGAVLGATIGAVATKGMSGKKNTLKKSAGKAFKAIGNVVDNVAYMMK